MTERRKFMRFQAVFDVLCKVVDASAERVRMRLRDLSKEGAGITTDQPMGKGTKLELEMTIPGDNMPVFAAGEVAWSEKADGGGYKTGVKFTKINGSDKAKLLEYVYDEWIRDRKIV
ncbi:MAG: PilZ domain-containing protein [Candidatus Omnitrophota bacterium]